MSIRKDSIEEAEARRERGHDHDGDEFQPTAVSYIEEPELPGMPPVVEAGRPYDAVVGQLINTLNFVEAQIEERVAARAAINAEIKTLREEHDRLTRMKRIAEASK